ncbi:MAG: TrmH family RNA methyltransferase [Myxococcota bacterium]
MEERDPPVRQLSGVDEIDAALDRGAAVELLLVGSGCTAPELGALIARARSTGVRVRTVSAEVLRRMSRTDPPAEVLALVGRRPQATLDELLAGPGAVWLLAGVAYPGNVGMAIRTAEVSGASGIIVEAGFGRRERRFALRVSVRSDWYMPVLWEDARVALEAARRHGRRIIGIEDVGQQAPWTTNLIGRVLLVVGGETRGIASELLSRCDALVRIPMVGFIPSYNLQAAVAALATERLRQLERLS